MADERNGSHVHGADRVIDSSVFAGMSGEDKALLGELIANVEFSRQELMRSMTDRRRNVDDECGYPKGEASAHDYQALYDYFSIAARVVELLPKECWQVQPTVYELENAEEKTPFEKAWDQLGRGLRGGEHSHYRTEKGSPVWEYLKRLDVLSGVGRYGVLLLGLDDGLPLNLPPRGFDEQQTYPAGPQLGQDGTPVRGPDGQVVVAGSPWRGDGRGGNYTVNAEYAGTQTLKLNYLKVFPEKLAPVTRWETNPLSPRHGQPCYYSVTFHDPDTHWGASLGTPLGTAEVHWARVLHVADTSGQASSSDVFAPSRMRVVRRHLLDLIKMYGGDAEGFWLACVNYISFETNPQLGGSVKINKPAVRDMWERVKNGLDRAFMLEGLSAKSVAPTPVDPTPHVDKAIEAICIILGCPVRVFKGSERGELASSQDDQAWNDRLRARQRDYVTPRIIVPFVDRLILLGVLPRPDAPQPPPETAAQLQAKKPADPAASPPGTGPDEATDATGNPPKPGEKTPTKGKPPAGKKPFPPQPSANAAKDQPRDSAGRFAKTMYRGVGQGADTSSGFEWFSETPELAGKYADFRGGEVKSASVTVTRPFNARNPKAVQAAGSFFAEASKQADLTKVDKATVLAARKGFNDHFGDTSRELVDYWSNPEAKERTRELLESLGFDGIEMQEGKERTVAVLRKHAVVYNALVSNLEVGEDEDEDVVETPTGEYADPEDPASEDEADALDPETEAAPMGYTVDWPDLTSQTDAEEAAVAAQWTTALATYIEKNLQTLITPLDYLVTICGFDETEARQFLENTRELGEVQAQMDAEAEAQAMAKQAEMIEAGLAPDPTQPPPPGTPPAGGPPQPGASPFPPKPERPKGPGAVLANYDPNQPRDKEGQFASTSGGNAPLPGLSGETGPKAEKKRHPREQGILDAAAKIPVTDDVVKREKVKPSRYSDYSEVKELMTKDERNVMNETLSAWRESAIDSMVDDYDPEVDEDSLDRDEAHSEAGWTNKDVMETAVGLEDPTWDDEKKAAYTAALEKWYGDSNSDGVDALDELGDALADDFPDQSAKVYGMTSTAEQEVEAELQHQRDKLEEEARDRYREQAEYDYDNSDDLRTYLEEFYDSHKDEMRFAGAMEQGKWGREDGEKGKTYLFETTHGTTYEVWSRPEKKFTGPDGTAVDVVQIGFNDASGDYSVTGAGGAAEVFSTVSAAVVALAQKDMVPAMYFTAKEESRQKLYDRLVKTVAKVMPEYAAVAVEKPGGGKAYYVALRPLMGPMKKAVEAQGYDPVVLVNSRRPVAVAPEFNPLWLTPRGWPGGLTLNYDPNQPRADDGKFGSGGGGAKTPAGGGAKTKAKRAKASVHFHGDSAPGEGWKEVGTDDAGKKVWAPPGTKPGLLGKLAGKKATDPSADAGTADAATIRSRQEATPEFVKARAEFDRKADPEYEAAARAQGKTADALKAETAAKAQAFADAHDVYVRCPADVVDKIVESGRLKNVHEVKKSRGVNDPGLRAETEAKAQGVPRDTPPETRPISCYLGKKDFAGAADEPTAAYGEVVIKPKASVRDRSTVTFDDSLAMATQGTGQASPLTQVDHRAVTPRSATGNPRMFDSTEDFHKEKGYAEVQVHGGLSLDDVEEMGFPSEPPPHVRSALEAKGVKVRVYGKKPPTTNYETNQPRDSRGRWSDRESGRTRTQGHVAELAADLLGNRKLAGPPPSEAETLRAVSVYTDTEHFVRINTQLRKGKSIKSVPPPELQALQTMATQPVPDGVVVYHGLTESVYQKVYAGLTPGKGVKLRGFLSTTLLPKIAGDYGTTLLEISAKTGLYVADKSKFPFEQELVKASGTTYRFDGVEESVDAGGRKHRVVKLTEV